MNKEIEAKLYPIANGEFEVELTINRTKIMITRAQADELSKSIQECLKVYNDA